MKHSMLAVIIVLFLLPVSVVHSQQQIDWTATLDSLDNRTYLLPEDGEVTLQDGEAMISRSEFPDIQIHVGRHLEIATGDINQDGVQDVITIVGVRRGGTGLFYYVAPFLMDSSGSLTPVTAQFIGDRIGILRVHVNEGLVKVTYIGGGAGCCPTTLMQKNFQFESGMLNLVSDNTTGTSTLFANDNIISNAELNNSRHYVGGVYGIVTLTNGSAMIGDTSFEAVAVVRGDFDSDDVEDVIVQLNINSPSEPEYRILSYLANRLGGIPTPVSDTDPVFEIPSN